MLVRCRAPAVHAARDDSPLARHHAGAIASYLRQHRACMGGYHLINHDASARSKASFNCSRQPHFVYVSRG